MSKWEKVRLGDLCTINPPNRNTEYISQNILVSFIPMSNVSEDGTINTDNPKLFSEVCNGFTHFIEDDVLFAKITPCMENGKGAIARGLINGIGFGSTEFHVLRPNKKLVTSDWVYRFVSHKKFRKIAEKHMTGSAGQKRVPKTFLENALIPLPPLEMQIKLTNILNSVSELLALRKQQLAEMDQLIKSVFYDMFGDPVVNEKGWKIKTLNQIAKEKLSYGSGASAISYDGNTRYIRITDINDDGTLNEDKVSPSQVSEKYYLNDGDILFARSGATVGKTLRFRKEYGKCVYAGYLIRLVPDVKQVLPDYVFYYTKTDYYRNFIESNKKTVAQPNINAQQFGDLKICVPPLELQNQFADIVTKIEEQKALVRKAIDETQMLFDSLMSQYFD